MAGQLIRSFLILTGIFCFLSCGGGTDGTSEIIRTTKSLRRISGSLRDTDGVPISSAIVNVRGQRDVTATTDSGGRFDLLEEISAQVTLEVSHQGANYQLEIDEVDSQSAVISVDAVLDRSNSSTNFQSVEGIIRVSSCNRYARVRGNRVQLTLPSTVASCYLAYGFRLRHAQPENATLTVRSRNCGGVSFVETGTEVTGDKIEVSQALYISKLRGVCSATVSASFPGLKIQPEFKVDIGRR